MSEAASVSGVGTTAVAVAAGRALESTRPDALVRDPWAALLVRASGVAVPYPDTWPEDLEAVDPLQSSLLLGSMYIGLRTRFIDDEVAEGALGQVVILGSGLDTRPWRLDWPAETTVFTLDSAEVLYFVARSLERAPRTAFLVPVPADVTGPWAGQILAAGLRPTEPTQWVVEGLFPYLAAADQTGVLEDIALLSAPGSRAVIERAVPIEDTPEARERLAAFAAATGVPMDEVLARADPPDPAAALARAGWSAANVRVGDLEQRYHRPLRADGSGGASVDRGGFVTAVKPSVPRP